MAITNTRISTLNPTTVFEAAGQQAVTVIYLCNTTASPVSFSLFIIASPGIAGTSTAAYTLVEVTAYDTYVISQESLILSSSDKIVVIGTVADALTVTVSSISV